MTKSLKTHASMEVTALLLPGKESPDCLCFKIFALNEMAGFLHFYPS